MENEVSNLVKQGSFWLPESASTVSSNVDKLYYAIAWGSTLIFLFMLAVGLYFLYAYRRKNKDQMAEKQITHNNVIELAWTVIPLIIVMGIFWWGYTDYLKLMIPPSDAQEIRVTGKKWLWQFEYPKDGIKTLNEIVVPVNKPIKLVMSSEDVIHSFFIPNFRVKKDVIPNRYSRIWFQAEKEGVYQIFCTEFCGDGHSGMLATLKVVSEEAYQDWLKAGSGSDDIPLLALGEKVYKAKACNTCHSIDGTPLTGPSWKGIYGKKHTGQDGKTRLVDDNYIRESVTNPAAFVVQGFPPVMPTYAGLLSDREIDAIIEFIKEQK